MGSEHAEKKTGCIFQWKIHNYSYCWQKTGSCLQSPEFSVDVGKQTKWKLYLYPRGRYSKDIISVYIYRIHVARDEDLDLRCEFSVLSADGLISRSVTIFRHFTNEGRLAGYTSFLKRDDLFTANRETLLPEDTLTIRCSMWTVDGRDMRSVQYFARTVVKVEHVTFIWSVKNFIRLELNWKIPFAIRSVSNALLAILHLFVEKDCCCERIWLEIEFSDECMQFFTMQSSILDERGEEVEGTRQERHFHEFSKSTKYPLPWTKRQLMENDARYLPAGVLSLKFECASSTGTGYEGIERIDLRSSLPPGSRSKKGKLPEASNTLTDDIKSLYGVEFLCDLELRTSTSSFSAHKIILCARSPVFTKMFATDFRENKSKCVEITDMDSDTLRRLLLYIYTDTLEDLDIKTACRLYEAADKYWILSLKDRCSAFLKENLDTSNACEVLAVADMHNDEDFKLAVQEYILEHECVFRSEKWKYLISINPKLTSETMFRKFNRM
ncbi:Speckle-type POZ protein B [Araneus ventricosus]|uniref:Speckle-type POZ protein B n=1 Tax=Araneus ventricosus TaxID=182803 RepID=A0A4Y2Q634_ARAVE|nr:Speckle-type POZ protein B [Araneus ventricosus]